MARIRSVHPDICESEVLASLDANLERTFTRLWTYLDDQGRGKDEPRLIKAAIYPLHDEQTWKVVDRELAALSERGLIIRWEQDGKKFLACRPESWDAYQHVQHPKKSSCPVPPGYGESDYKPKGRLEPYHSSGACSAVICTVRDCSGCPPEASGKLQKTAESFLPVVVEGVVDVGGVGSSEAVASEPSKPSKPFTKEATQLLRDWVEAETPHRQITRNSWPGKMAAIRGFLNNGWTVEALRPILLRAAVVSTDAIQLEIGRSRRPMGRDPNANQKSIERVVSEMAGESSNVIQLERGPA